MIPRLFNIEEAAEAIGRPVPTLRHWRAVGKGPAFFKLGKTLVVTEDELARWIAERQSEALAAR